VRGAPGRGSSTGGTIFLTDDALWLTVLQPEPPKAPHDHSESLRVPGAEPPRQGVHLKFSFPGANPHARLEPFQHLDTHVSYYFGNDPKQWHTNVPVWGGVRYVDFYPGLDLEITSEAGQWLWRLVLSEAEGL